MKSTPPPPENPFVNLLVNILLPVMVLNKGSHYLDPHWTLAIALLFPLTYGVQDYVRRRHKNYVSLIGLFNVLLTGSFVVLNLRGFWFAVKEAVLPLVLGGVVLGSAFTLSPAARMLFCNPHLLNIEQIEERLTNFGRHMLFDQLLKKTTIWLSLSFFLSALCNFLLARFIFVDIDGNLAPEIQSQILNEQIARMTWMGFAVIALPLMIFSGVLVYWFMRRVAALTELPIDSLLKS